ncbi:glutamine synthetase/guanido kinase [Cylindrobasidium torrendii FP15055 ss-10]|uniref:Glutamine synthetase n=1 Tax=Cylindrobasidium torrendii FP15055 ss-10 TaxID=1314674 RepID=A0A0D7BPE9_9AGAR|nr:glutamine synthetase/guanido kinase [Cylindrobasidium torrendii FP15055 ss-10]
MASAEYKHGVVFTPASVAAGKQAITVKDLEQQGIAYIMVTWVDFTMQIRLRVIPISYFKKMLQSSRPGVAIAKASLGLVALTMAEGFSPVGEFHYALDMSTLRICPYKPGFANVFGWLQEKAPRTLSDGRFSIDTTMCPRGLLRSALNRARDEAGVEFLCGFEPEFMLLKSTTNPKEGVNYHHFCHSSGLLAGSKEETILREVVDSLIDGGVEVTLYHAEAAPGQYEVVTGPLQPLEAADAYIYSRMTIVNVAAKHGMHATFAPRVFMNSAGSGSHIHISAHSLKGEEKTAGQLSRTESSFLSGLLKELPAIVAMTLPTTASYARVGDDLWSGGTWVSWGTEHRETPIRLSNAASPKSRNFEMRFIDGTSNPYLVLALILSAGTQGVQRGDVLTMKECDPSTTPAHMSPGERNEHGITERMPLTWASARETFASSAFIKQTLGESATAFLSINKTLNDVLQVQGESEAETLTRLVEMF